jgi:imidazole glycerol-phosphate synthase subunit HisF
MFRPRIIPVLLLKNNGLVKSIKFKNHNYIGDPINAVKIFNDLRSDELVFLDINATKENRFISLDFVKKVSEEANMPFAVGGGIKSLDHIHKLISLGAEKAIICSEALRNPNFIKEASNSFGTSTISVCIDYKKTFLKNNLVFTSSGNKKSRYIVIEFAKLMQDKGAGEIILQSITRDGTMEGYDLDVIKEISSNLEIPVVALGGAGKLKDLQLAFRESKASALAAGSLFIYQSKLRGVLINYPEKSELKEI